MKRSSPQSTGRIPDSHVTGRRAVDVLRYKLPASWIVHATGQDSDYGIDLRVEVVEDGAPTGTDFNVQVKGTTSIRKPSKAYRVYLKAGTISYLLRKVAPTLIVLCDVKSQRVYYAWLHLALELLTTRKTESGASVEIDFGVELDAGFEKRTASFLEDYYRPIVTGLRNPDKIRHLTSGALHAAQTYEFLANAYVMGLQSLLREKRAIEGGPEDQDALSWATTWAVNTLGMFLGLFRVFMQIYPTKYAEPENIGDQQLRDRYVEFRKSVSDYLPVAGIENEGGEGVVAAGDFIVGRVNIKVMWEKSPETLQRLRARSEKLRELVLLAWKLEKRPAVSS
jgi:hypothetical protein